MNIFIFTLINMVNVDIFMIEVYEYIHICDHCVIIHVIILDTHFFTTHSRKVAVTPTIDFHVKSSPAETLVAQLAQGRF